MKPAIPALLVVAAATSVMAAPPPAPVGFIWTNRGVLSNPFNAQPVSFVQRGIAIQDNEDANNQWTTGNGTINLGVRSVNATSTYNAGAPAGGQTYFEVVTNELSLNFAVQGIQGSLTSVNVGNQQHTASWQMFVSTLSASAPVGSGSFAFKNILNQTSNFNGAVSLTGIQTNGSNVTFDAGGGLRLVRGNNGLGNVSTPHVDDYARLTMDVSGTATINQSFNAWELTPAAPIPEPKVGLLLLAGLALIARRRRPGR